MKEWFCTVFPNDLDEMPQDFESYAEAKEYGDEMFGESNYTIESPQVPRAGRRIDYKCVIVDFVAEMKISRIL